jgi:hypothetical protein
MGVFNDLLNWEKVSWPKRIAIAIPFVAAFIGWQYYSKHKESQQTKAEMLAMCEGETRCLDAVEKYAEACFGDNYRMGRRSQGVKTEEFVACINKNAGEQLFVSTPIR